MSTKLKLALFLIPAIAAIVFLIWWRSPTQVVLRRLDALLELADVGALRLAPPEQLPGQLKTLIAPNLDLHAPFPVPSGTFSPDEIAAHMQELHGSVGSCRVTREEASVYFPSAGEARVKTPLEAQLSWGRGSSRTNRYHAELRFTKSADGWLLDEITLLPR
jgi:hypothetical protein